MLLGAARFRAINYIIDPPTRAELEELLRKLSVPARPDQQASARALLRTNEPEYRELGLDGDVSDDRILAAIAEHPSLLQRPIVVNGDRAVIARPVEKVLEVLTS
jgi:arsenate reductase